MLPCFNVKNTIMIMLLIFVFISTGFGHNLWFHRNDSLLFFNLHTSSVNESNVIHRQLTAVGKLQVINSDLYSIKLQNTSYIDFGKPQNSLPLTLQQELELPIKFIYRNGSVEHLIWSDGHSGFTKNLMKSFMELLVNNQMINEDTVLEETGFEGRRCPVSFNVTNNKITKTININQCKVMALAPYDLLDFETDSQGDMDCSKLRCSAQTDFHFNVTKTPFFVNSLSEYQNVNDPTNFHLIISKQLRFLSSLSDVPELPQIINGEIVKEKFHHVLQLIDSRVMRTMGTGNIIGEKLGITAAHVTKEDAEDVKHYYAFAGSYDSKMGTPNPIIKVKRMTGYIRSYYGKDISLLYFKNSFNLSSPYIKAIGIVKPSTQLENSYSVAGWGLNEGGSETKVLLKATFENIYRQHCKILYPDLPDDQICFLSATQATNKGDSGSGYVNSDQTELIAINSSGFRKPGRMMFATYLGDPNVQKWLKKEGAIPL